MRLFHYTSADDEHLGAIVRAGAIRPTAVMISSGERPAAWFSAEPSWEPTATKMVQSSDGRIRSLTEQELADFAGLARIEVRPEAVTCTWKGFKAIGGASPEIIRGLEHTAIRCGGRPWLWRVSFEAVPSTEWLCVEERHGDGPWVESVRKALETM